MSPGDGAIFVVTCTSVNAISTVHTHINYSNAKLITCKQNCNVL